MEENDKNVKSLKDLGKGKAKLKRVNTILENIKDTKKIDRIFSDEEIHEFKKESRKRRFDFKTGSRRFFLKTLVDLYYNPYYFVDLEYNLSVVEEIRKVYPEENIDYYEN